MAKKLKFYTKKGSTVMVLTEDRFPFLFNWMIDNMDRVSEDYVEAQTKNKLAKYGIVTNNFIPTYLLGEKGWEQAILDIGVETEKISISFGAPNKVFCYLKQNKK